MKRILFNLKSQETGMVGFVLALAVAVVIVITGGMLLGKVSSVNSAVTGQKQALQAENILKALIQQGRQRVSAGEILGEAFGLSNIPCWRSIKDANFMALGCVGTYPNPTLDLRFPGYKTGLALRYKDNGVFELKGVVRDERTNAYAVQTVLVTSGVVRPKSPVLMVNDASNDLTTYSQLSYNNYQWVSTDPNDPIASRSLASRSSGQLAATEGENNPYEHQPDENPGYWKAVPATQSFNLGTVDTRICYNYDSDATIDANLKLFTKDVVNTCVDASGDPALIDADGVARFQSTKDGIGLKAVSKNGDTAPSDGVVASLGLDQAGSQTINGLTVNLQGQNLSNDPPGFFRGSPSAFATRETAAIYSDVLRKSFDKLYKYQASLTDSVYANTNYSTGGVPVVTICPSSPPYEVSTNLDYINPTILYVRCNTKFTGTIKGKVAIVIAPWDNGANLSNAPTTVQFNLLSIQGLILMRENTQLVVNGTGISKVMGNQYGAVVLANLSNDVTKFPRVYAPYLRIGRINDNASLTSSSIIDYESRYIGLSWFLNAVAKIGDVKNTHGARVADISRFESTSVVRTYRLAGQSTNFFQMVDLAEAIY